MTRSEWIEKAAEQSGITKKELRQAYDALFDVLLETLKEGESVQISGLGSFVVRVQEEHVARNPKTNRSVTVPTSRKLVFLPGKKIKEQMNET